MIEEEVISQESVQEPPYKKKVFDILSSNFDDFKLGEQDFYKKLATDKTYASKVHDVLIQNFSDFKKPKNEFIDSLTFEEPLKKKDGGEVFSPTKYPSVSPDFEKGKAFAEKGFVMKGEGTKEQKRISIEPSLLGGAFGGAPKVKILEEEEEPSALSEISGAVAKGMLQGKVANILSAGKRPTEDELGEIAQLQSDAQLFPQSKSEKLYQEKGLKGLFKDNPLLGAQFIAETMASSLSSLIVASSKTVPAAALAGAAVGAPTGVGALVGAGYGLLAGQSAAGYNLSTSQDILNSLSENGVDISNKESLIKAFSDETKMAKIRNTAAKYGVPILIFDAATAGLAGKLAAGAIGKSLSKKLLAGLGETGIQVGGGMGGEFTAQVASGKKVNWDDVIVEGLAQVPGGASEIATGIAIERSKSSSNNKTLATQIATQGVQNGSEDAIVNLNRDLSNNVITPEQHQEGVDFVQKASQVAEKIPENVTGENKVKSIELLVERNDIKDNNQNLIQQKQASDEAYHAGIDEEIKANEEKIKKIDSEVYDISKKPSTGGKKYVVDGKEISQEEFDALQDKPIGTKEVIKLEAKTKKELQKELIDLDLKPLPFDTISNKDGSFSYQDIPDAEYKDLLDKREKRINEINAELKSLEEVKPTEDISKANVTIEGTTDGYKVISGDKANSIGDIRQEANEARKKGQDTFTKETIKDGKKIFTLTDTTVSDAFGRPGFKSASISFPEGTKVTMEDVMPKLKSELGVKEVKPTEVKESKINPIEFSKTIEDKYGITIDLTGDVEKGDLTLSKIEVPKEQRGKEIGTKAMEDIIKYADENNKRIVLTPSTDFGGTSVKRLKQFYKKFGFIENTGKNKDFTTKETMYRNPEVKLIEEVKPAEIPKEVYNPIVDKIKKGIQKLSDKAKVSVLKGKNFTKALEDAIKTGGVNLQSWGGFEKKGFEESPQWQKLIDNGTVKLNFDIKGLEGKPVVVINPDNMLTGEVVTKNGKPIVDGNGGINFVTKFGDVWASSDNTTANTLARYINEARQKDIDAGGDGTIHVVVTKGDLSKSLTSHTGAKAAMKVLEYFVDKKLVSLSDFRKALTEVGKKYNIDFDGRLDAKAIHDDIAKKFFGVTDSTFSKRGFFVQDIIDNLAKNSKSAKENIGKIRELLNTEALPKSTERKTGEISFAKEGIIDAIGHLLSDNMTVGVKNSEIYATIEIKHPVEVFNLNKEEGGHESYPFHLRQIDENGNKVKPVLNVLSESKHVTDILNDSNNNSVDKKGGAGKFGSNQIGMAKGFVKPAAEHPTGVNMMTDATGKIYGFEQNGKIVLNADLMNGNTPFHEAGHLWLSWAKENRSDLHDAGMNKIENSTYLKDVKNNKVYQENASKLPKGEREAYFKSEALAKAIGDNGEKFVTETQKSDFKKWVKDLWKTIATHFGLKDMSADEISNLTLDEFSKKVVGDIIEARPKEVVEIKNEGQLRTEYDNKLLSEGKSKKRQENVRKTIIDSNFDQIVKDLIRNNKIEKIC